MVFLVVPGIIDTKFHGFKGSRLYAACGGRIADEEEVEEKEEVPRFEPSHDPSAISEDARRRGRRRDPASSVRTIFAHGQILSIEY